jgi:hypothetical protein
MDRQTCKLTSNLTVYNRFLQIVQRNHASKQVTFVHCHILMNSMYVIVTTYFMLNNSCSWWWLLTLPTDTRSWCNNSILFYYVWNVHSSVSYYLISLYSDHCVIHRSSFRFWPLSLSLQKFSKLYSDCRTVGRIPWNEDLTIATPL